MNSSNVELMDDGDTDVDQQKVTQHMLRPVPRLDSSASNCIAIEEKSSDLDAGKIPQLIRRTDSVMRVRCTEMSRIRRRRTA